MKDGGGREKVGGWRDRAEGAEDGKSALLSPAEYIYYLWKTNGGQESAGIDIFVRSGSRKAGKASLWAAVGQF